MEVHLTPDQEAFIHQRVRTGRFASPDEAVQEAVSLLEQRETESGKEGASGRRGAPSSLTGAETENLTGASLVAAMQASPYREIPIEPSRPSLPVRDIVL